MKELLQQLADRLATLDCLAQPTKAFIMDCARQRFNEAQLQEYLDKILAFVEGYNRVMGTEFHQLCKTWASPPDQAPSPRDGRPSALKTVLIAMLRSMVFTLPVVIIVTGVDVVWRICEGTMEFAEIPAIFLNWLLVHTFTCFSYAIWSSFKFRQVAKKLGWLSAAAHYRLQNPLCCIYCPSNRFALPVRHDADNELIDQLLESSPLPPYLNVDASFVAGHNEEMARMIDLLSEDFGSQDFNRNTNVPLIGAVILSFSLFSKAWVPQSFETCRRLLSCLRYCISRPNLPEDVPRFFLEKITPLRHLIVGIGHSYAAQERNAERAKQHRLEVLRWDAEMGGSRLLLERYLLGHPFRAGGDGANTLDGYFVDKPAFFDPPPSANGDGPQANAARPLGCFGMQEVPSVSPPGRRGAG